MKILIRYSAKTRLSEGDIDKIISISEKHGEIKIEKWGMRSGAIDFVSILEISFLPTLISALGKPVIEGYIKGLMNETYYKNLGEKHRKTVFNSLRETKSYLSAFYEIFISSKKFNKEAIAIVEHIGHITLYVALNGENVTNELIDNLGEAMVKTYGYISLGYLNIETPHVIQLFPNLDTNTWDYLFIPTVEAFGNYINRYFDYKDNKFHFIYSAEEFIEKFEAADFDDYKYIISAKHHLKSR